MNKNMMIVITAGLIGFSSASAAASAPCSAYSDTERCALKTICNAQPDKRDDCLSEQQQREGCPARQHTTMQNMQTPDRGGMNSRGTGINGQPGLTDRQSTRIEQLRQKYFDLAAKERQELTRLNHDLRTESLNRHPDRKIIEQLAENIGRQQKALAVLNSTHMEELAALLTPSQHEAIQKMTANCPTRGNCDQMCQ
jgi:Spy/CpxP family protein refolding chaperone